VTWDRLSQRAFVKRQDALVRDQVRHVVAPFSPYWKSRFAQLGTAAGAIDGVAELETVPAVGERDVSPSADPSAMAALVLQAGEGGFALHAAGPTLRRALWLRLAHRDAYRRLVETDTKPTSYVWSGLAFRYPLASTRGDLDVVARAGARLWQVLGLDGGDALLSAVPVGQTTEHVALQYAALAAGAPAMFPGADTEDVVAVARVAPPTVLAVPSSAAADVVSAVVDADADARLRTVLLVGMPAEAERSAVIDALGRRADAVAVLAVHAPAGARVLWAECREAGSGGGLHTYPDLEVVQLVDPETGEPTADGGEVVLTQLQLRGSALLRWRTGDLTSGRVDAGPCVGCGRTVPRLRDVRRSALVLTSDEGRPLDLRALAGALAGRADVSDWRVVLQRRARDGQAQVIVQLATSGDPGQVAAGAAGDVRSLAGMLPSQMIVGETLPAETTGEPLTPRILLRG
jgi:phenylacetate-coenzyme A ligase PaaK-like adenylate-forming protein